MKTTDITGQIESCPFPQWYLERGNEQGIWLPEEVAAIEAVLRPAMQAFTDTFGEYADNYWRIWKCVYHWSDGRTERSFTAIKRTWEYGGLGGQTAEEIAQKLQQYYAE